MSLVVSSWRDVVGLAEKLSIPMPANRCATEVEYLALWKKCLSADKPAASPTDLLAMAVTGGLLADRMAWVFVGGYQSAIRHTFMREAFSGWVAFAVSEDRKGQPPLPGVTVHNSAQGDVVSGYKTWVACSDSVEHLVIKAGSGADAGYFNIHRTTPGLTVSNKRAVANPGSFLAEMSQGIAHLQDVAVAQVLDDTEVARFGIRETLYIYCAFCAHAGQFYSNQVDVEFCAELIRRLGALLENLPTDQMGLDELKAVDTAVQKMLGQISPGAIDSNWSKDRQLIAMYSPGIQKREMT